jgi:uncharacterized protein
MPADHKPSQSANVEPAYRKIRCPRCKESTLFAPSNPFRPFCSERCKTGDLGAWASNEYTIHGAPLEQNDLGELAEGDLAHLQLPPSLQ